MHRFYTVFLGLMLAVVTVMSGCGGENLEEKLYGGWKSEPTGDNKAPIYAVFSKDAVIINGKTEPVVYQSLALTVGVAAASDRKALLTATGIGKDSVELQGDLLPLESRTTMYEGEAIPVKIKFVRIPAEEALKLMDKTQSNGRTEGWNVFIAELW